MRGALELARSSLEVARQGMAQEFEGAEEWFQAHTESVQRLEQLLALVEDPAIADGAVIILAKSGRYNLVEQALHDRGIPDSLLSATHQTARLGPPDDGR